MDGAKKYWWVAAVVVPVVVALIAIIPKLMSGGGGNKETIYVDVVGTQYNGQVAFNNVTIVAKQASQQLGSGLSAQTTAQFQQALDLAQAKQFKSAIPLFESLAKSAPVPAVYNNLGAAYLGAGNKEMAVRSFERALAIEPAGETARFNLGQTGSLAKSDSVPPPVTQVAGVEQEPNDTILQAPKINVGQVVASEISSKKDHDFFQFRYEASNRDQVIIHFENSSTSLRPHVKVFNQNKSQVLSRYDSTYGANISVGLTVEPGANYYVQVLPYDGSGKYRLRVEPQKAYDQHEPNDGPFTATAIKLGQMIEANIMDGKDDDWYKLSGVQAVETTVRYSNRSTTLRPHVFVYDKNKAHVLNRYNSTYGADLEFKYKSNPGEDYFLKVVPYGGAGAYQLQAR